MPETQESKKVLNLERAAEMWQATKDYVATHAAQPEVTSGTEDEAAWLTRETAAGFPCGGRATVKAIKGKTVKWNQLNNNTSTTDTLAGVTATYNGDGTWTLDGTATANGARYAMSNLTMKQSHKYLVRGCPAGGSVDTYYINISGHRVDNGEGGIYTWNDGDTNSGTLRMFVKSGTTLSNSVWTPQLFDLTLMFGAGNEPSTVAEFERLYPAAYYPYSAPTLQSAKPTGIESEDADGGSLGGISIPASTYFPDGMRSAGTAADELTSEQAITRIASANLGDRMWNAYSSGAGNTYYCNVTGSVPVKAGGLDNLISAEHAIGTSSTALADGEMIGGSTNNRVYIRDDSCLTADAMKTARAGEIIYYEMEEPTTVTIDPPLNFTYRCEAGGTETVTHTEATSAPTLDIVYEIDGTAAAASIAPLEGRIASANYSLGALIMLGGTLVKVTTAIATGEAIILGQNVAATTVAAELAALA